MNEGTTATIKIANSTITPLILFKKMSSPRSSWKVRHRGRIFWFRYKHCDVLEEGRHPFQTCVYYVQVAIGDYINHMDPIWMDIPSFPCAYSHLEKQSDLLSRYV